MNDSTEQSIVEQTGYGKWLSCPRSTGRCAVLKSLSKQHVPIPSTRYLPTKRVLRREETPNTHSQVTDDLGEKRERNKGRNLINDKLQPNRKINFASFYL